MQTASSEKAPLLATDWRFLTLVASLAGFAFVAWLVDWALDGAAGRLDRLLYLSFRYPDDASRLIGPEWLVESARDITSLGSYPVLSIAVLVVVAGLILVRRRGEAFFTLAAIVGASAVSSGLKTLFGRARPDLAPHAAEVFTQSFPSAHAMMSTVVYLTLAAIVCRSGDSRGLKGLGVAVAAFLIFSIGVSRVYLGVHWPSDVLAGWLVGAFWALSYWLIADRLFGRADFLTKDAGHDR